MAVFFIVNFVDNTIGTERFIIVHATKAIAITTSAPSPMCCLYVVYPLIYHNPLHHVILPDLLFSKYRGC